MRESDVLLSRANREREAHDHDERLHVRRIVGRVLQATSVFMIVASLPGLHASAASNADRAAAGGAFQADGVRALPRAGWDRHKSRSVADHSRQTPEERSDRAPDSWWRQTDASIRRCAHLRRNSQTGRLPCTQEESPKACAGQLRIRACAARATYDYTKRLRLWGHALHNEASGDCRTDPRKTLLRAPRNCA